jgi:hypothetical protein
MYTYRLLYRMRYSRYVQKENGSTRCDLIQQYLAHFTRSEPRSPRLVGSGQLGVGTSMHTRDYTKVAESLSQ